jgi:hypothetical protein
MIVIGKLLIAERVRYRNRRQQRVTKIRVGSRAARISD